MNSLPSQILNVACNANRARQLLKIKQMEPKGFIPYFEEPKVMAEIDIRGRFMMMAC
jgi:hypothetical protein